MKKLLFIIPGLNHGGTNRSLQNLINEISCFGYEIEIMAFSHSGPYKKIFSEFKLLKSNRLLALMYNNFDLYITKGIHFAIIVYCYKFITWPIRAFINRFFKKRLQKSVAKSIDKIGYHKVIAYQEGEVVELVSLCRTTKIAWIHSDYKEYQKVVNQNEFDIYDRYDKIVCVSNYTLSNFIKIYPSLIDKSLSIHNLSNIFQIREKSKESIPQIGNNADFVLLSIGRLSEVKQFDKIPEIAYKLSLRALNFRWYIIGEGKEREIIKREIEKYGLTEKVILLGAKNNPYPYILNADLLVITSFSEACPIVINEAFALNTPVLSTRFGSVNEFITNNKNGYICDIGSMHDRIIEIFNNDSLIKNVKYNILNFDSNKGIILKKLMSILN